MSARTVLRAEASPQAPGEKPQRVPVKRGPTVSAQHSDHSAPKLAAEEEAGLDHLLLSTVIYCTGPDNYEQKQRMSWARTRGTAEERGDGTLP